MKVNTNISTYENDHEDMRIKSQGHTHEIIRTYELRIFE